MENKCRFCSIIKGKYLYPDIDKPFLENDSYIAMASIGAFIEGWTIIVPKNHGLSMKGHYFEKEFIDFFNSVSLKIYEMYGRAIAFEHSSSYEGSATACGSNHAHIHIVPFDSSLLNDLMNDKDRKWKKINPDKIYKIHDEKEYLFYSDLSQYNKWSRENCCIHFLESPISQYFRRVLALKMKIDHGYDYKTYPCVMLSEKTALELKGVGYENR